MDCSLPQSSEDEILQARILVWIAIPFCSSPEDLPNPGLQPGSPELQADTSPSELQESPI